MDKRTPVVIPLGSCEQHGRHLPVFVDTIQVTEIAGRAERELGDQVLLLPTLWLGSSDHHRDYPGTVSVSPSLYSQVIQSMARCVLRAGFTRVVFLNGHGGNHGPVAQALSELVCQSDEADAAHLLLATWWEISRRQLAPERHGMTTPQVSHACEYETSLMLAIRPDLVRLGEAVESAPVLANDWVQTENVGASRVTIFKRFHRLSAAGSLGRPSAATAQKGRSILDAVVGEVVELLRDLRDWPDLPVLGRQ